MHAWIYMDSLNWSFYFRTLFCNRIIIEQLINTSLQSCDPKTCEDILFSLVRKQHIVCLNHDKLECIGLNQNTNSLLCSFSKFGNSCHLLLKWLPRLFYFHTYWRLYEPWVITWVQPMPWPKIRHWVCSGRQFEVITFELVSQTFYRRNK